jgi:16S rRNA (guanine527-N7)-methyltransferase
MLSLSAQLGDLPGLLRRQIRARALLESDRQLEQMEAYLGLLVHWNESINLTGARTLDELVQRHVGESLAALPLLPNGPLAVADAGSGAGFPGLPLRIARPDLRLFLVERQHKKAVFLRQAALEAGLDQVEVVEEPWESWSAAGSAARLDCVLSRAALDLEVLLQGANRLLRPAGRVLLFLGQEKARPLAESPVLGGSLLWKAESLLPGSERRYLVHLEKPL